MAKPAALIVHAQVVAMVRTEGNEVPLQMLHMELGVLAVVVAVVKVRGSVGVAAEVMIVVRTNLYNIIMEVLDLPLGVRMTLALQEELIVLAPPCKSLAVDA